VLRFRVNRDGRVLDYAVVSSTGYADLDAAVVDMMRGAILPPFPANMTEPEIEVSVTVRFDMASSQPIPVQSRPQQSAPPPSSQNAVGEPNDAYRQGATDSRSLRTWFESLSGALRAGADYWASNRSERRPAACGDTAKNYTGDKDRFVAGCQEAKARLDPIDVRRLSEPQYRAGFSDEAKRSPIERRHWQARARSRRWPRRRRCKMGTVRNFVRRLGMMGAKEPGNAATQRATYS
jgi:TonB family protein